MMVAYGMVAYGLVPAVRCWVMPLRAYDFLTNSPILLDRHRVFLVDDVALVRVSPPLTPPLLSALQSPAPLIQRCVVVTRQADGYGLTVTGDHPVYVHTVKPDGAAFRAGVRQGDKILKVNGMPVTASNHLEVVRMISGGQTVALTLLGRPPEPLPAEYRAAVELRPQENKALISGTVPLEGERKEEWKRKRVRIISEMLEDERRHVEGLRETCVEGSQLERALQRIESLQSQLRNIETPQEKWMESSGMHYVHTADIIPMEEGTDDDECEIPVPLETQGPFSNIADLKTRPAHLAAFINYLLANANPSSLFFYLITDAYQNSGAGPKEMRKWAYEIFSTFLIPNAPMCWNNIDQSLIQSIDKVLAATVQSTDSDLHQLKKIFVAARKKSLDDINEHLADFRQKRQMGLGSLFDANQLAHISKGDTAMEARVGETILIRSLENMLNSVNQDVENCEPRSLAVISALATVIKVVLNMRSNTNEKMLDRCPTFVTKDKGGMFKMKMASKRSIQLKGHQFLLSPVNLTVYCYQCRDAVWGVNAQAYFCQNCDVVLHKQCTSALADHCYPATQKKVGAAKSKRPGSSSKCDGEEASSSECHAAHSSTTILGNLDKVSELHRTEHPKDNVKSTSSDSGIGADLEKPVFRSQSMRSRAFSSHSPSARFYRHASPAMVSSYQNEEELRDVKRGRSTLPWGGDLSPPEESEERSRRTHSDAGSDDKLLASSISRTPADLASISGSSSMSHASMGEEEARRMLEKIEKTAVADGDSDLEVETEIPPLDSFVGWEVIRHLKPKEKKRQEVINELFHTERTHVRNLKVLYTVFYKPMVMQNVVPPDVVKLFFANLDQLVEIHGEMSMKMRNAVEEWKRDSTLNGLFGEIGALMESMFDGENGKRLMEATSAFCQHQQHALDILRQRCKKDKDDQLGRFLADAECNPLCRKLQLKDMLPVEMQRLVKYPLLLETVAKYTNEPSEEQTKLLNSVNLAKKILSAVNTSKRNTENLRRLEELQRRLDTAPYDKENFGNDFNSLNLTNYKLVHDGALTWRFSRGKMVELHVVLLEDVLVLLTKVGDGQKLLLKIQEPSKDTRWSPILPLAPLIAKEKANDKRAFFIVNTMERGAQIYELVAATATERKTWFKLISDQIDFVKRENTTGTQTSVDRFDVSAPSDDSRSNANAGEETSSHPQRVQVSTHPRLVNANEITVQQPTVLQHAQPILTPTERLRRNDEVIVKALLDKHAILSQFLPGPNKGNLEELDKLAEQLTGMAVGELKQRDARELAMSAIVHGNRLLDAINQGMSAKKEVDESNSGKVVLKLDKVEPDVPSVACYKLTAIAAPLMNHLKAMMQVVQDQQNEISAVKQQLYHYKELAEGGPGNRTVSEETLTELNVPSRKTSTPSDDTEKRKRLQTKRQRNSAVAVSPAFVHPPSPTSS
uniref:Rho guanine nucleotide exchange factor 12 n=1 Tax=Ascaris suum TaxID=6253 RepID=F1KQK1_ASCSU